MTRLRPVLLGVATTCLVAGIGIGLAVPVVREAWAAAPADGEREAFVARFRARYDLRDEQVRDLRAILLLRDDERLRIAQAFDLQQWPPEARSQLMNAQRRTDRRIEHILDERQLALYRQDLQSNQPPR